MRPVLILLLLGSFATSALAAEAAEIHDPTFQPGYAYTEPGYPPVNGSLVRLTRCWPRRKQYQSSVPIMTSAYEQGRKAAQRGKHIQACPFDTGTVEWHGWRQGFCDAHKTISCSPDGPEKANG